MRTLASVIALLSATALAPAEARAADGPVVHAHRGGALAFGAPVTYEDTLEAFRARIAQTPDVWLEMDALVSKDGVPYVLHDSTVDRTTTCTGAVKDLAAAQLDACRVDRLGVASEVPGSVVEAPADGPVGRLPRLADVLALARAAGAPVNLEIKRIPGDPGYLPGDTAFATRIMEVVAAARLDPAKLIVQSFDPSNLEVARTVLPGVQLSFLSLADDASGVALCASRGYAWYSPNGAPTAATVQAAHAAGVRVVPYTLDTQASVAAAAAAGVDALITNDVPLALRALGREPAPVAPAPTPVVEPTPTTAAPTTPQGPTATTVPSPPVAGPAAPAVLPPRAPLPTPAQLVLANRSRTAVLRARRLAVVLRGPGGTAATVRVTRGRIVVARRTVRLPATGTDARRAHLRLTRAGARVLGARSRVVLRVRVTLAGATTTRRLTLR